MERSERERKELKEEGREGEGRREGWIEWSEKGRDKGR